MRKKIIAGNWKMNLMPQEAVALAEKLKDSLKNSNSDVVVCVPFVDMIPVRDVIKDTNIQLGAQNMYFEDSGAFTGEISPSMLKEVNVSHVIIGHSERRALFGETDELVNLKVKKALETGIMPIVCVGETLEQRESGITIEWVRMQVKKAFEGISASDAKKMVIAYEPIWAIGTGRTATSEQAQEVCRSIRAVVQELYGDEVSQTVRIQYGGSVNAKNCKELFHMPDIDGGLVGGASLKEEFIQIVHYQ